MINIKNFVYFKISQKSSEKYEYKTQKNLKSNDLYRFILQEICIQDSHYLKTKCTLY